MPLAVQALYVVASVLAGGLESGEIEDGTIADSLAQRSALWLLRERIPEAEKRDGGSVKHDVSVRIGRIPEFVARASDKVARINAAWDRIKRERGL